MESTFLRGEQHYFEGRALDTTFEEEYGMNKGGVLSVQK